MTGGASVIDDLPHLFPPRPALVFGIWFTLDGPNILPHTHPLYSYTYLH